MYAYVYMHTWMNVCATDVCVRANTYIFMHTHTRMNHCFASYTHIHAYIHTCTQIKVMLVHDLSAYILVGMYIFKVKFQVYTQRPVTNKLFNLA
jgi:hypothetical protein